MMYSTGASHMYILHFSKWQIVRWLSRVGNWPQWCMYIYIYSTCIFYLFNEQSGCSPREKKLNLLVQIKFLNLFLYNKNWKIYWPEQSFTGLGPDDRCSMWGLMLFWSKWVVRHNDTFRTLMVGWALYSNSCCLQFLWNVYIITYYTVINALIFY